MSKAVEVAQEWVKFMIQHESKGAGDTINAMRRLSQRHKIPYSTMWSLKYKPPADLFVTIFEKLKDAYENEIARAEKSIEHERKLSEAKNRFGKAIYRVGDVLAGKQD